MQVYSFLSIGTNRHQILHTYVELRKGVSAYGMSVSSIKYTGKFGASFESLAALMMGKIENNSIGYYFLFNFFLKCDKFKNVVSCLKMLALLEGLQGYCMVHLKD